MKFKKITAIATSVLMAGMTVGMAAAANYPAPFVENGMADVAVVYGTGAGVSSLDQVQAGNIQSSLGTYVKSTSSTTVEGGEAFALFKDNEKLHFGDAMNAIMDSDLDDNDLEALADGEYDSGSIDVEYEQTVSMGTETLKLITESDLNDEEPTIGYFFDDAEVLTYTLSLDENVAASDMDGTDFPLFGKEYYVLEAENAKITLLDSAEKTVLAEGETVTVDGRSVSIAYINSAGAVKFTVDGETTDKLENDGDYYELDDGSYIVLSEALYSEKDGVASKAEFSLGSGKVILENSQEVEVNEETIDGLVASISGNGTTGYIDEVALTWSTDGDVFLTEGDSIDMPVFGEFGLVFNGMDFGSSETISIENGETLTLSMGNYDVELMFNDTTANLGGDEAELVSAALSDGDATFAIGKDQRFLGTLLDEDLSDVQTAYYEVTSLESDSTEFDLKLNDMIGEDDIEFIDATDGDDEDIDDINVKVLAVFDEGDSVGIYNSSHAGVSGTYANTTTALMDFAVLTVSADENIDWDVVVSETGMVVEIPSTTSDTIDFFEANEDNELDTTMGTPSFTLAMDYDSDDDLFAKVGTGITMEDETADDKTVGYDAGIHATKVMEDSDAHTLEIEYYADEVAADLQLIAGGEATTSKTSGLGDILIKDSEVAASNAGSFIVVGGSCINSAAATVLGGAYCGEAFTEATGVSAGEFLIKGMEDALEGKFALVVAGYEAADTANAATYLTKKDVDTSKMYKGTSATEAELIIN